MKVMYMLEKKSIIVMSGHVKRSVKQMQLFGWKMVGNQDVGVQNGSVISFTRADNDTMYKCHQLDFIREWNNNLDRIKELEIPK